MKNIQILDCTLRDGGRIINCAFPNEEIKDIAKKLTEARIDIVEVGFLRDKKKVEYNGNSTFFTDVDQITPFLKRNPNTIYVAFIDYGMYDFNTLKNFDGNSIDGIRFGFTKADYAAHKDDIINCANIIKRKGYKLFIQGVNSLNYSDREILELVDIINQVSPYSFGIVDTYGAMYIDDVDRIYGLIDNNMNEDIHINFHSHNNYQLSFAFAQEVIKLSKGTRNVIIDSTLGGMGKVAGNLNTELIVDYLVRKLRFSYEFETILDLIDEYIHKYASKYTWGYSIPAMMAGIYKAHPNNIIYLLDKFRLETKDIGNILSMIDPITRQRYDYNNIENLYTEYVADKIDDYDTINKLKNFVDGRKILVIAPGSSLNTCHDIIQKYIDDNKPFIISVNFVADYPSSFAFFGNQKRYNKLYEKRINRNVIISSNIKNSEPSDFIVNYHSLINRGYKYFENSTVMLLNLLNRLNPKKISIAGFDGFTKEEKNNYYDNSFQNYRRISEFDLLNKDISNMLTDILGKLINVCKVEFITPSLYSYILDKIK